MSNNIELINPYEIDSPALDELTTKLTEIMKLEISQAILNQSNPNKFTIIRSETRPNNIDSSKINVGKMMVEQFNKETPVAKEIMLKNLKAKLKTDIRLNNFAKSSNIKITGVPVIHHQLDLSKSFPLLSTKKGSKELLKLMKKLAAASQSSPASGVANRDLNKELRLKLHSVKCLDETDHLFSGVESDKIHLGVIKGITDATDLETLTKTDPFLVASNFEKYVTKAFNPPQTIAQFSLNSSTYPKTIFAIIALAEIDDGGFNQFLLALVKAIKEEAEEIVELIMAAAIAGGVTGTLVEPGIGTLIGIAAGIVLGALIAWFEMELKDDIFPPQTTLVVPVKYGDETFDGRLQSPIQQLHYAGHGGRYRVNYTWQIIR